MAHGALKMVGLVVISPQSQEVPGDLPPSFEAGSTVYTGPIARVFSLEQQCDEGHTGAGLNFEEVFALIIIFYFMFRINKHGNFQAST